MVPQRSAGISRAWPGRQESVRFAARGRRRSPMASKKSVNLENLEALGARRLAEIVLELGAGDAGIKRRLRLELSAEAGAEAVAADIGKRLTALRQARSLVAPQKPPALLKNLHQ